MPISTDLFNHKHAITLSPMAKVLIVTNQINDVANIIEACEKGDVVFIDIDDTIQTISSYLFQTSPADPISAGGRMIEQMKSEVKDSFACFISRWRLSRRSELVHKDWPVLIHNAQEKGVSIYGLTHMDTGSSGVMSRVEEWRYNQLSQMGIHFTQTYHNQTDMPLMDATTSCFLSPPVFYKGIFFTGSMVENKKNILTLYGENNSPARIIMIDDRIQNIQAAQEVPFVGSFTGVVFRGVDLVERPEISGEKHQKILQLQQRYLEKEQWLENDEAMAMIDLEDSSGE